MGLMKSYMIAYEGGLMRLQVIRRNINMLMEFDDGNCGGVDQYEWMCQDLGFYLTF